MDNLARGALLLLSTWRMITDVARVLAHWAGNQMTASNRIYEIHMSGNRALLEYLYYAIKTNICTHSGDVKDICVCVCVFFSVRLVIFYRFHTWLQLNILFF
jgi:hypothetical protein